MLYWNFVRIPQRVCDLPWPTYVQGTLIFASEGNKSLGHISNSPQVTEPGMWQRRGSKFAPWQGPWWLISYSWFPSPSQWPLCEVRKVVIVTLIRSKVVTTRGRQARWACEYSLSGQDARVWMEGTSLIIRPPLEMNGGLKTKTAFTERKQTKKPTAAHTLKKLKEPPCSEVIVSLKKFFFSWKSLPKL